MRQPIRRKRQVEVTTDPVSGQQRILDESHENDYLVNGSIDSIGKRTRYFRDCGCDGPVGGRCQECGALSCQKCHGHCFRCSSPICLEHSISMSEGSKTLRLCRQCHEEMLRSNRLRKVARTLLQPFVRFED